MGSSEYSKAALSWLLSTGSWGEVVLPSGFMRHPNVPDLQAQAHLFIDGNLLHWGDSPTGVRSSRVPLAIADV